MNPWLDGIVGGWTFSGTARFQRQSFILRNAVLVGMTMDEAQDALSVIRFVTDPVSWCDHRVQLPGGHLRQHAAGVQHRRNAGRTSTCPARNRTARWRCRPPTAGTGTSRRPAARAATSSTRVTAARRTLCSSAGGSVRWTSVSRSVPAAGPGAVRVQRGSLQRHEGAELPEHDQPGHEREHVPHDDHAERRARRSSCGASAGSSRYVVLRTHTGRVSSEARPVFS